MTAHHSQDLPEGEYAIKQPTAIAAAVRVVVSSMHANLLMVSQHLIVVNGISRDPPEKGFYMLLPLLPHTALCVTPHGAYTKVF